MQEFKVPSSKSISNRLLIIKYLSQSKEEIHNLSIADDTVLMQKFIWQLNEYDKGINKTSNSKFFCHNAGTVIRFLISLLAFKEGIWRIDGDKRMRERPIEPLLNVLIELGSEIKFAKSSLNKLPIEITGSTKKGTGIIQVDSSYSSQFISSLLLVGPYLKGGLNIEMIGNIVSKGYIDMTISLMKRFGVKIKKNNNRINVKYSPYIFKETSVTSDWSSACFAYEKLSLMKEGELFLRNFSIYTIQPDSIAKDFFSHLGVKSEFSEDILILKYDKTLISLDSKIFDISNCPDIFPPLAVSSLFSGKKICFVGLESLKHKESNRIKAMFEGLKAIGGNVYIENDKFIIDGFLNIDILEKESQDIIIKTYDDHRIAMAFGIVGFKYKKIKVDNRDCVSKSFPLFWENLI